MFVPSRSALPIAVQPSISTIPCRTLNHLIPPVLFSPVFANPHLRPPALAGSANPPPRPQSASSPSPLPVRRSYRPDRGALRGLCVKISPPLYSNIPVQPSAALQMFVNPALQTVVLCHPLHQNQKSRPLFSTGRVARKFSLVLFPFRLVATHGDAAPSSLAGVAVSSEGAPGSVFEPASWGVFSSHSLGLIRSWADSALGPCCGFLYPEALSTPDSLQRKN